MQRSNIYRSVFKTIKKQNLRRKLPDRRGRHTKESRAEKLKLILENIKRRPSCENCAHALSFEITTDCGDALVCSVCGVVDSMPIFDSDSDPVPCIKGSPMYRHRYYFGERIKQAKNEEPRFKDGELDILSKVHDLFTGDASLYWDDRFFTKKHMAIMCRLLTKQFPKSFWTRRSERWFQFRTYICGNTGLQLPQDIAVKLRFLFDAYSRYFQIYITDKKQKKKANITQLDIVILILLFSLDPKYVNDFGWYFLNKNLINRTPSTFKNYTAAKEICEMINQRILKEYFPTIPVICYRWFRLGNSLKVPDLDDLIDCSLGSELGAIQYANYCKQNTVGAYLFYKRNMVNFIPEQIKEDSTYRCFFLSFFPFSYRLGILG